MSNKTPIKCPNCGKQYFLIEESYPMRDKDKLPCEKCGYILKEWDGGVVYSLESISDIVKKNYEYKLNT